MRRTSLGLFAAGIALSAGSMLVSGDAQACGGCFTQASGGESTIVTAHRMALSVSSTRTVLWDQIQYQGSPEEFAWVLPVKPGTTIELASDAFFEALDAATSTRVNPPVTNAMCGPPPGEDYMYYGGCAISGCGADGAGMMGGIAEDVGHQKPIPPVEVVHEDSIGPYESVVLSSNKKGALYDWLVAHGYGIDPSMESVVDSYEAEGFDFVALRLVPGADVRQMRPVRVISPGAAPVLPLRMVAAGTGANVAMTLFILGEGRWEAQNFANGEVYPGQVQWDFATSSSNYGSLRQQALLANGGSTWITTYSKSGTLFMTSYDNASMQNASYQASNGQAAQTIADLYFLQGQVNGDASGCGSVSSWLAYNSGKVVELCEPDTGEGGTGGAGGAGGTGTAGAGGVTMGTGGTGGVTMSTGSTGGVGGATGTGGTGGLGGSASTGGTGGLGGSASTAGAGGVTMSTGGAGGVGGATGTGGTGGAPPAACLHSFCSTGEPLSNDCDPCVAAICSQDPYCCGGSWDQTCVNELGSVCGLVCSPAGKSECQDRLGVGDIDAAQLACGDLDDLAVALVGMHPSSVWITRLEANLPRAALGQDLQLQAANQQPVENNIQATSYTGDPCGGQSGASAAPLGPSKPEQPRKKPPFGSADLLAVGLTLATLLGAAARRALRKTGRIPT